MRVEARPSAPKRLVELASGVDALYLSGRASVPEELFDRLGESRSAAEAVGAAVPFAVGGTEFSLEPHGWGKYRFCLRHRHGQVGITPSLSLPALRVQPRAEFLHGAGALGAVEWFEGILGQAVGPLRFGVSRLDLHADWQGWDLDGDQRRRFVCRAERRDLHEVDEELTGFEFGRRSTGSICARIYDKAAEVAAKGTDFWPDIWGERYDRAFPVHRVEFEFGRQGLREFGVGTPREALDAAGALWASVTEGWLTYRSPTSDQNRSRWPLAPEWLDVQRASLREGAAGAERMYEGRRRGQLRKLMPVLNGYMVSFAALIGAAGMDGACARMPALLRSYEVMSRRKFSERVAERVREYQLA